MDLQPPSSSAINPIILQSLPSLKQIAFVQIILFSASLIVTWYLIWWDTLLAIGLNIYGYYLAFNPIIKPTMNAVQSYHYGSFCLLLIHIVAICVILYHLIANHIIFGTVISLHDLRKDHTDWSFYSIMLVFEVTGIITTSIAIKRSFDVLVEIKDDDNYIGLPIIDMEDTGEYNRADKQSLAVQNKIQAMETALSAIKLITEDLEDLSTNIEKMRESTKLLNTYTGNWLAAWKGSDK